MILAKLRAINKNQVGLTLIEMMIAMAITGIVVGTTTMVIFQVFDGEARSTNHMDAISRLQDAGRQISLDISMAQSIEWPEGSETFLVKIQWRDWDDNELHEITYVGEDNKLTRVHSYGGGEVTRTFDYIIILDPDTGETKTYCEPDPETDQPIFTLTAVVGVGSQAAIETRVYGTTSRPAV